MKWHFDSFGVNRDRGDLAIDVAASHSSPAFNRCGRSRNSLVGLILIDAAVSS